MWIQVRSMDGKVSTRLDDLSKLTKIEELRVKLIEPFNAPVDRQRLFYRGKQLENGHTLFDYDVGLNDIIQILIKPVGNEDSSAKAKTESKEISHDAKDHTQNANYKLDKENELEKGRKLGTQCLESNYFRVGDLVDAKDRNYGAWFEAEIIGIKSTAGCNPINEKGLDMNCSNGKIMQTHSENGELSHPISDMHARKSKPIVDSFQYLISFQSSDEAEEPQYFPIDFIRPRARKILKLSEIKEGDMVMVNYNVDEPKERGFWYDCMITCKSAGEKTVSGTIFLGSENAPLENCRIVFKNEIFQIEELVPLSERKYEVKLDETQCNIQRKTKPQCSYCKDIPTRKCKNCSCHVCGGKNEPSKQILCDECDLPYHIWCLDPPLSDIPKSDEWYCPLCKNDDSEVIKPGEKLKGSRKKAKMASAVSSSSRDWGKGMACVGRTKECTIVPSNHFGPVPGIEVGMMWKFRVQVSESGVHRPHVAGIHGRESEGAFSIVLSGGYEDDVDDGEEFKYTGSGGRDLSGNKRTADQSCDQTLTRMNKALAMNCATALNNKGGEAINWKEGKPVRVVRNCKGRKHSKYCPEEGNRYDGIYKVVKYWPEKGKSGYLVWRYLLRRDDPVPAPWTKAGKKRIKSLNLSIQYPDGYLESISEKSKSEESNSKQPKKKGKRSHEDRTSADSPQKRTKVALYKLPSDVHKLITEDILNKKTWEECEGFIPDGSVKFLKEVENHFSCICCQEIVVQPITTECLHNICKSCLQRSFKAEVFCCPMCRYDLGKNYSMKMNGTLSSILKKLFPGYDVGR